MATVDRPRPYVRSDGIEKVTGTGRYTADLVLPGQLHAKFRYAGVSRARIVRLDVERALDLLRSAERPLVIVGKGMAYSRAEEEVRAFIERTKVPFLASPMGKGVMPDTHPLSVGAARRHAL